MHPPPHWSCACSRHTRCSALSRVPGGRYTCAYGEGLRMRGLGSGVNMRGRICELLSRAVVCRSPSRCSAVHARSPHSRLARLAPPLPTRLAPPLDPPLAPRLAPRLAPPPNLRRPPQPVARGRGRTQRPRHPDSARGGGLQRPRHPDSTRVLPSAPRSAAANESSGAAPTRGALWWWPSCTQTGRASVQPDRQDEKLSCAGCGRASGQSAPLVS